MDYVSKVTIYRWAINVRKAKQKEMRIRKKKEITRPLTDALTHGLVY